MLDHDRWFKELITTFFEEFILAFFPNVYEHLDFHHVTFLNQEVFTDVIKGRKGTVDLLVETKLKGNDTLIIIHIEPQSTYQKDFNDRMFIYFSRLYEKYRRPIVPIAIFSYDKVKTEKNSFIVHFPFKNVLTFQFFTLQLKQKNWRDFVKQPNPVALALLGKMGYEPDDKVKMKLEFLRMLVQLQLDPARQKLVHGIFEKYHNLSAKEELELNDYFQHIPKDEVSHIMELMTSWEKKGIEKVALQMLVKGYSMKEIQDLTNLSAGEIERLKDQLEQDELNT